MNNSTIYIVHDDDYDTIKVFKNRHNAIDYMYHKMIEWGAPLFAPSKTRFNLHKTRFDNLINLHIAFPEEDSLMIYLYERNEDELNYIFDDYFTYNEATFEDEREVSK